MTPCMLCSLNLGDRDRVVVIWLARAQACLPHAIHWHTQDHRRIASARIAPRTQVSQGFFDIAQDRNSSNLGPETRFSCARGRTRKLCGSISFVEGLAETQRACAESLAQSSKPFRGSSSRNRAENPSRKQPRKAETKRLQVLLAEGSRKGFAEAVVSVVKLYIGTKTKTQVHSTYRGTALLCRRVALGGRVALGL